MPGFNTLPAVGGGGGQANMTFVASVHMQTYNRTWAQGGTTGYYAMYSTNQENGYVYFVGSTTTGGPLNRLIKVEHAFTSINIIAPQNDMVSLYKAKVKATTVFNNPFDAFASFPSQIASSGNFVLPNNALPLVNVLLIGGGGASGAGHGDGHGGGGGGGGGGAVKLTAYQAVGTTSVTIGTGGTRPNNYSGNSHQGGPGNRTYFGNVYANGGGGGGGWSNRGGGGTQNSWGGVNGGGGCAGGSDGVGGIGLLQTATTGLGYAGTPQSVGGYTGGAGHDSTSHSSRGGGGSGGGANGTNGTNGGGGNGGAGHTSDISGSSVAYGPGGAGSQPNGSNGSAPGGYGAGGTGSDNGHPGSSVHGTTGGSGIVIVRYYIP
jgi:hypothetical protein